MFDQKEKAVSDSWIGPMRVGCPSDAYGFRSPYSLLVIQKIIEKEGKFQVKCDHCNQIISIAILGIVSSTNNRDATQVEVRYPHCPRRGIQIESEIFNVLSEE